MCVEMAERWREGRSDARRGLGMRFAGGWGGGGERVGVKVGDGGQLGRERGLGRERWEVEALSILLVEVRVPSVSESEA